MSNQVTEVARAASVTPVAPSLYLSVCTRIHECTHLHAAVCSLSGPAAIFSCAHASLVRPITLLPSEAPYALADTYMMFAQHATAGSAFECLECYKLEEIEQI